MCIPVCTAPHTCVCTRVYGKHSFQSDANAEPLLDIKQHNQKRNGAALLHTKFTLLSSFTCVCVTVFWHKKQHQQHGSPSLSQTRHCKYQIATMIRVSGSVPFPCPWRRGTTSFILLGFTTDPKLQLLMLMVFTLACLTTPVDTPVSHHPHHGDTS